MICYPIWSKQKRHCSHLRRIHHRVAAEVSVGEREHGHDGEVGGVRVEHDWSQIAAGDRTRIGSNM